MELKRENMHFFTFEWKQKTTFCKLFTVRRNFKLLTVMNVAQKKERKRTEHKHLIQFDLIIKFMLFISTCEKVTQEANDSQCCWDEQKIRKVLFLDVFLLCVARTIYSQLSKYHLWRPNNRIVSDILLNGLMSLIFFTRQERFRHMFMFSFFYIYKYSVCE